MKLKCLVKILKPRQVSLKKLTNWLKKTLELVRKENKLKKAELKRIKDKNSVIELFFVEDAEMKRLNRTYLGKDKTTDVLSFSFLEPPAFVGENYIGQIFISPKIAKKQAGENCWSLSQEIEFLFVHAVLHVLGYDHQSKKEFEKMFGLHFKIMKKIPGVKEVIEKYREESF